MNDQEFNQEEPVVQPVEIIEEADEGLEDEMRTREKMRDTQMKERLSKAQNEHSGSASPVPQLNVQRAAAEGSNFNS